MNVFVLCTGRCGSTTFARACRHITNFTVGNESRIKVVGYAERVAYPPAHIEIDNRLSWLLGALDEQYGDNAHYVHLSWTRERTSSLLLRRLRMDERRAKKRRSIIAAFARSIIYEKGTIDDPQAVCEHYWDSVQANIRMFLKDKSNVMQVSTDNVREDFVKFWQFIGAEGDIQAALAEFDKPPPEKPAKGLKKLGRIFKA